MKQFLAVLVLVISGCSSVDTREKAVGDQALSAGLVATSTSYFDASFIAPKVNFSGYKKIIINDLDLSQVDIIEPSAQPFVEPWALSDNDKRLYQKRFLESANEIIIDSAFLLPTTTAGADTLVLKTKLVEIAPRASKDDFKSRPGMMDVYSEGFGRMTIVFELYDSVTNKLVLITTDDHELGNTWELNNRVQNNFRIRLAFDYWLRDLKRQLNAAKKV